MLPDHSHLFMDSIYFDNDGLYQDDNSLRHWTQVVQIWFKEHFENVQWAGV